VISRIHQKLGTVGFVISIVALVAALGGGAYAASGGLNGKQKKEVEKIAKKYAGKNGTNGTNGAPGATGPAGAPGAKGDAGSAGASGNAGSAGVSVTSEEFSGVKEGHCAGVGGSKFTSASGNTFSCNGKAGSPWTAGGTLPPKSTETGTWNVTAAGGSTVFVPVSFAVPLAGNTKGVYVPGEEATCNAMSEPEQGECLTKLTQKCPGVTNGMPQAAQGELCLYELATVKTGTATSTAFITPSAPLALEAGPSGTIFKFECEVGPPCTRIGSWAVTAE
jgi:hypothetical protein